MTAPVKVKLVPGDGPFCESSFTMSFFVPLMYQNLAPEPNDPEVFLEDVEPFKAYVRVFGGYAHEKEMTENAALLAADL